MSPCATATCFLNSSRDGDSTWTACSRAWQPSAWRNFFPISNLTLPWHNLGLAAPTSVFHNGWLTVQGEFCLAELHSQSWSPASTRGSCHLLYSSQTSQGSLTAARDQQQGLITKSCYFSGPSHALSPSGFGQQSVTALAIKVGQDLINEIMLPDNPVSLWSPTTGIFPLSWYFSPSRRSRDQQLKTTLSS